MRTLSVKELVLYAVLAVPTAAMSIAIMGEQAGFMFAFLANLVLLFLMRRGEVKDDEGPTSA